VGLTHLKYVHAAMADFAVLAPAVLVPVVIVPMVVDPASAELYLSATVAEKSMMERNKAALEAMELRWRG